MNTSKKKRTRTFLFVSMLAGFLMLGAALSGPVAARADGNKKPQVKRYYDKNHKDYHEWNDNEEKAYGAYLDENHQQHVDFAKVKAPQQQQYFDWRHDHPDSVLFKVDIK